MHRFGAWYIPKILQKAMFGLLLFSPKARLKTRNRVDYYSILIGPWTKKSNRPKHSFLKNLGYKLVFLILSMVTCASYAQIYKWTDSQGSVHFSDTPHEGAQQLSIPESQSYSQPSPTKTPEKAQQGGNDNAEALDNKEEPVGPMQTYSRVELIQPENEATVRNNQGAVDVAVLLEPKLVKGDSLQALIDGVPYGKPQSSSTFQISEINRGTHVIAVQLINSQGKAIKTTASKTFYMQRPRVGMVKKAP